MGQHFIPEKYQTRNSSYDNNEQHIGHFIPQNIIRNQISSYACKNAEKYQQTQAQIF